MRKLASALVALTLLTACATTPDTRLNEGKGLATAWASLDAVAVTLDGLATSHTLKGPKAAEAAKLLSQASAALTAADIAYRAGNGASAQQNVAVASALIASLIVIAQGAN